MSLISSSHPLLFKTIFDEKRNIFITGSAGCGKCLKKSTKIIMFDGSIKKVENIQIGDLLMGDDSTPRTVLSLCSGTDMLYEITNIYNDSYIVNSKHILSLLYHSNFHTLYYDVSILDYINLCSSYHSYFTEYRATLDFYEKFVELHPYIMGLWLGYSSTHNKYKNIDKIILNFLTTNFSQNNNLSSLNLNYSLNFSFFRNFLSNSKLLYSFHIPNSYKFNSRKNRLFLLAGLLDNIGFYNDTYFKLKIPSIYKKLLNDIIFLCKSLGFICYQTISDSIIITGNTIIDIPYKNNIIYNQNLKPSTISVSEVGIDKYYGFQLDGNHRFVLDNFIVTHNSTLLKSIYDYSISNSINTSITALTGCAAYNLSNNAITLHKWSGINLGKKSFMETYSNICKRNKYAFHNYESTQLLIIDEVSFMGKSTLELIANLASFIRKNDNPFGGIQIILCGDMLQLCPINDEYCFKSDIWKDLNMYVYKLTEPKRFNDLDYFNLLQRVRTSQLTKHDLSLLSSRVTTMFNYSINERKQIFYNMFISLFKDSKQNGWKDLIPIIFDYTDYGIEIIPTKMYSLRKDVDLENMECLNNLNGKKFNCIARDTFPPPLSSTKKTYYKKYLNNIAPSTFSYKIGAQIMLTYNIDIDLGLINGARGIIISNINNNLLIRFKNGIEQYISPINYELEIEEYVDSVLKKLKIIRRQYPLALAYCMSIHKSQSSTLDYVLADIGTSIFAPNMSYVVLSRVRSLDSLYLISFNPNKLKMDKDAVEFENVLL